MPSALTKVDFLEALRSLTLSERDWIVLRAQYNAPGRELTAASCAAAVGSQAARAGNLAYGTLARRVAEKTGFVPETRSAGTRMWWQTLSTGRDVPRRGFTWTMRPELAEALRELGLDKQNGQ